ncbi:MAG: transcriptional repressor [Clostridiales bacterium]|nr:transcriptional repressor [Clostridiales bacterium]
MKRQRSTPQRKVVLEAVRASREHPSADRLYLLVREQNPKISRGTVYRNLNLLVENGEVRHVEMPGVDRFDWRTEPHYHLLCRRCGRVCDAPVQYREELDRMLSEDTGFRIDRHITVFEGLCPDCLRLR